MRIATFAINRFANINIRIYYNVVQGRHSQLLDVAIFKNAIIKTRPTVRVYNYNILKEIMRVMQ